MDRYLNALNKSQDILLNYFKISALTSVVILCGCTAGQHLNEVRADDLEKLTVGTVQKELSIGMSGDEVISTLGSPNIVTTDYKRRESWIYDKISSEVAYSKSGGSIIGLIFGSSGGGLGNGSIDSGATKTTQRTLTIIVKFDES
ncbi:MAG: hypothetical protein ACE5RG_10900, partial [Candidatus Nitrosomaritimum yanchengensis]